MIRVTKLNGIAFFVNADQIETIEPTPDTMITLTSGRKVVVQESVEEVLARIGAFHVTDTRPARSRSVQIVHRTKQLPSAQTDVP